MGCGMSSTTETGPTRDADELVKLLTRERCHTLTPVRRCTTAEELTGNDAVVRHEHGTVTIYKATYAANKPSEDRSTVVVGSDFVFCGVWDGHGGTQCAEYVESNAFEAFAQGKAAGYSNEEAWVHAYRRLDEGYLAAAHSAPEQDVARALFAGACCVGAFIDMRPAIHCPADQHELLLHSAHNLKKTGWGRSDPYCRVTVNGTMVGRTPVRPHTQAPEWQASVRLEGLLEDARNVVQIEIMNEGGFGFHDRCEGVVVFTGLGLAAFEGCRRETGRFPVKLDGVVCGELLCQLHVPVCVGVGNLGDSRAVMGEYRCGELRTVLLSRDHTASDDAEVERLVTGHPEVDGAGSLVDADMRVKGICAFTRSVGDCQLKSGPAAAVYNSCHLRVMIIMIGTLD